jgi:bacillithiol biosynthesis deacetylase BshB1
MKPIDILAIGVHPDDVELSCAGTILKHIAEGFTVGLLDLTLGELGTRGNATLRTEEAMASAKLLGVSFRDQLTMADGFFQNDERHQRLLIQKIRQYRPRIVLCNAIHDRHPDHARSSRLVSDACFYSGLRRISTTINGQEQEVWRPEAVYHYVQDRVIKPDFVVDVTPYVEKKMEAIKAFASQFYDPNSKEPETAISRADFLDNVVGRMRVVGRDSGLAFAEAFTVERPPVVEHLFVLK